MYRKSRDIIRIYNPLNREFRFKFDGYWNIIGAHKTKDVERYLANHYFKKISDEIIGEKIILKGNELLKRREKQGHPPFLNKYDENKSIWDNAGKLNDATELEQIANIVILGLVEEYGLEMPPEEAEMNKMQGDQRTVHAQILDSMNRKIAPDIQEQVAPIKQTLVPNLGGKNES